MSEEFNFGKSVSETLKKVPGNEREELLSMIFKS